VRVSLSSPLNRKTLPSVFVSHPSPGKARWCWSLIQRNLWELCSRMKSQFGRSRVSPHLSAGYLSDSVLALEMYLSIKSPQIPCLTELLFSWENATLINQNRKTNRSVRKQKQVYALIGLFCFGYARTKTQKTDLRDVYLTWLTIILPASSLFIHEKISNHTTQSSYKLFLGRHSTAWATPPALQTFSNTCDHKNWAFWTCPTNPLYFDLSPAFLILCFNLLHTPLSL
jgi:hypothetical protein